MLRKTKPTRSVEGFTCVKTEVTVLPIPFTVGEARQIEITIKGKGQVKGKRPIEVKGKGQFER